jgi:hypothetical protein
VKVLRTTRSSAHGARPLSHVERDVVDKSVAVTGAVLPPRGRRVDDRVPGGLGLVLGNKVADPADHVGSRETPALGAALAGARLEIQHTGEGDAITAL